MASWPFQYMGAETYVGEQDTERQFLAAEQKIADGAGRPFGAGGRPRAERKY